jgi:DNA-directed RNA polymerase specialized sigma24 family protein
MTRLHTLRDPAAVLPWLQQIVRNCALMHQRRYRHEIIIPVLDDLARARHRLCGTTGPSPSRWHGARVIWAVCAAGPQRGLGCGY